MKPFYVVAYLNGKFVATISGLGCNRGTLDSALSKQQARFYAKQLSTKPAWSGHTMRVESNVVVECFGEYMNGKAMK